MRTSAWRAALVVTALLSPWTSLPAAALELHAVQFPERRPIRLGFDAAPGAPDARLGAEVLYRDGQARIDLEFSSMKPAVLYGGDVTCFVVWAVTSAGRTANLGELLVREPNGRLEYSTADKRFALMITAEPYYLVSRPSQLVVFTSAPYDSKRESSVAFELGQLDPAPEHAMSSIRAIAWDSDEPLELLQARKAYEIATRRKAITHAPQVYTQAGIALDEANEIARKSRKGRALQDASRRAVALSNEAINLTMHRLETIEVESRLEKRRAEIAQIERRASLAEAHAEVARAATETAREAAETIRLEQQRLSVEIDGLIRDRSELESNVTNLETRARRLAAEKQQLARQLESALSSVADTRQTARGLVVSLPDILFDVNQASLKRETEIILAKLAGILLVMPTVGAAIEGHTDSTGSAEYNLELSERRALSVMSFLEQQSIDPSRLTALGFGMSRPVAGNDTAQDRARNRRVEIVFADGK